MILKFIRELLVGALTTLIISWPLLIGYFFAPEDLEAYVMLTLLYQASGATALYSMKK